MGVAPSAQPAAAQRDTSDTCLKRVVNRCTKSGGSAEPAADQPAEAAATSTTTSAAPQLAATVTGPAVTKRPVRAASEGCMSVASTNLSTSTGSPQSHEGDDADTSPSGDDGASSGGDNNARARLDPVPESLSSSDSGCDEELSGPRSYRLSPMGANAQPCGKVSPMLAHGSPFSPASTVRRTPSPASAPKRSASSTSQVGPASASAALAAAQIEVEHATKRAGEAAAKLATVNKENDMLRHALDGFRTHTARAYEQQLSAVTARLSATQAELARVTEERDQLAMDNKALPVWVVRLQTAVADKEAKLETLAQQHAKATADLKASQAAAAALEKQVQHLRRKLKAKAADASSYSYTATPLGPHVARRGGGGMMAASGPSGAGRHAKLMVL